MEPAVFGYIRVSQAEGASGLATQRRILTAHGLRDDRIFTDVASGRTCAAPPGSSCGRSSSPATSSWSRGSTGWPEPLGGSQDHRGAARPGHPHPLPGRGPGHRRRQPHRPAHAPHAALPGRVGEGDHPGPDQGRRGTRRGRGQHRRQASGAGLREAAEAVRRLPGERGLGQRGRQGTSV